MIKSEKRLDRRRLKKQKRARCSEEDGAVDSKTVKNIEEQIHTPAGWGVGWDGVGGGVEKSLK